MKAIRIYIVLATITLVLLQKVQAQACRKVDAAQTAAQNHVLKQFIAECRQGRYFVEDKGIVVLTVYTDAKGQLNWWLSAMLDDRYKENLTSTYSELGNDIILVYQADSTGRTTPIPLSKKSDTTSCLEGVIKGRVYVRPTQEDYVESVASNGSIRKSLVRTLQYGNHWNSKHYIFKADGTYTFLLGQ